MPLILREDGVCVSLPRSHKSESIPDLFLDLSRAEPLVAGGWGLPSSEVGSARSQEGVSIGSPTRGSASQVPGKVGRMTLLKNQLLTPALYGLAYAAVFSAGLKMQGGVSRIPEGVVVGFLQADATGRGLLLSRKPSAVVSEDDPAQGSWQLLLHVSQSHALQTLFR